MAMAWALVIIRVSVGLTLAAHGAQKLFGWFGGAGFARMRAGFRSRGYRPAWLWVALAIVGELGGGLSLAVGFLAPLGAAGAVGAMVMAASTHWAKGFFNSRGGFEYPLALLAMAVAIGVGGPGAYSVDHRLKIALPGLLFAVLALCAVLTDVAGVLVCGVAARAAARAAAVIPQSPSA